MNNNDTNLNGANGGFNPSPSGFPMDSNNGMNPSIPPQQPDNLQSVSLGNMNMGTPVNSGDAFMSQPQTPVSNGFAPDSFGNPNLMNQPTPQNMQPMMDSSFGGTNMAPQTPGMVPPNNSFGNPSDSFQTPGMQPMDVGVNSSPMNMNPTPTMDMGMNFSQTPGMNMNPSMDVNPNLGVGNGMAPMNNGMQPSSNPAFSPNPFSPTGMDPNGMNPMGPQNMIGAVPTPPVMGPQNGKKKKEKKPLSKTTIILFVVLLILVIGCGVYFILHNSKASAPKVSIVANDMILDLGKPLSTQVSDYGSVQGYDIGSCTVDTSKVDLTKMGSYEYTITCGAISKTGTVVLQDNVAPEVEVREVNVVPGAVVNLEDFIVSCNDFTTCTYELDDRTLSLDSLTEEEGTYQVDIVASDEYNNETKVTATLVVSLNAPVKFMYCTPTSLPSSTLNADLSVSYNYGISAESQLVRTQKISTYTFSDEEEYTSIKTSYVPSVGIDGMIGEATFDDAKFEIVLTQVLTEEELSTEFNVSPFPTDYDALKEFHINQGISCRNR